MRGVAAASWFYFGKRPTDLSLGEAASLAGLPQSPSRLRPDRYPVRAGVRRRRVLARMAMLGMITTQQQSLAASEPVVITSSDRSFLAPHASWLALRRRPRGGTVTIDPVPQFRLIPRADGTSVGYFELATFISTADAQLEEVFATFRQANVTDVIIDLRYNSGGLVSTTELLGDFLGGAVAENLVFSRTLFNANNIISNVYRPSLHSDSLLI